jgi:hypothetical protein
MPHQSSFSSHFNKISNSFATNLHCSNCDTERLMMISAIEPALFGGRDKVVYQCTDCGTENSQLAMVYRSPIATSGGKT